MLTFQLDYSPFQVSEKVSDFPFKFQLMPRERTGSVIIRGKSIFARVRYVDESGKTKSVERKADNRSHARRICKDLLRDLETHGEKILQAERMTFAELADYYENHYAIPPRYVSGRKTIGLRSWKDVRGLLKTLKDYFGARHVRAITYGDLKKFRATRMEAATKHDKARAAKSENEVVCTRSVASVNRELATLRKVFNVALAESWIIRNPFTTGDNLISLAAETKRERILTREEETRLLKACGTPRLKHLRPILIAALDTGARRGELLSLRWKSVDFESGVLTVTTFKDKNAKDRQIAFTTRVKTELLKLWESSDKNSDTLVFGIKSDVKHGFDTVRKAAGLEGFRFHDLRHTAATRLVEKHIPLAEVGRMLGHSQPQTTYRYANANLETARRAASALDDFHNEALKEAQTEETESH